MKILHTADWHLGMDLHKVSLLPDQQDALEQLSTIVIEEDIDVIIVAGDVYDTTLASKEAIELYNTCMKTLCMDLKKQVILIAGNHDSAVRLATCSDLLAPMGLHIYGKLEEKVSGLRIQDTVFYPIPYLHPQTVASVYGKSADTQEEAFSIICEDLKETMEEGVCHVVIAHAFIAGSSVCESDRFASVGGSDLVSAACFEGFDYVALGHLHRPQQPMEHVCFSGSLLPYSFSEADTQKQVMIYDSETGKLTSRAITPLHELKVLKGSFAALKEQMTRDDGYPSSYVKVQVEDIAVSYEMLAFFQEHYPNLLQLSGRNEQLESRSSLNVEELETVDDVEILKRFFTDLYEEDVNEEELRLFQEAQKALEEV